MIVQGYELPDLDTYDPDVLERIESAFDKVISTGDEAEKQEKRSANVRMQCEAIAEFIDNLFGEGTAVKVFDGKVNLLKATKAFEEITVALNENSDKQAEEINNIVQKYSPSRAARRGKSK